jgi:type IV secretion system protein VirB2
MIHALRHGARRAMLAATASVIALTISAPAHAGGSSMPWEAPLQSILESIEGPVAKIIAVIIIIVTGLTLAFGDTSGGFRRLIQIVLVCRSPSPRRASFCRSSRSAAGR